MSYGNAKEIENLKDKLVKRELEYAEIIRIKVLAKDITVKRSASYRIGNIFVRAFRRPGWRTIAWPLLIVRELFRLAIEKLLKD
jgi:hypothetical protein